MNPEVLSVVSPNPLILLILLIATNPPPRRLLSFQPQNYELSNLTLNPKPNSLNSTPSRFLSSPLIIRVPFFLQFGFNKEAAKGYYSGTYP